MWNLGIKNVFSIILISCSNFSENINNANNHLTPYAQKEELESIAEENYVDYRIARFFALEELGKFSSEENWTNAEISEYPIVIYNSKTLKPSFYEFRVIKNNEEIGAISCTANEKTGEPVQYILPFAKRIEEENSRSIMNGSAKIIDTEYPGKFTFADNEYSRNAEVSEEKELCNIDERVKLIIESVGKEALKSNNITEEDIHMEVATTLREEKERLSEMWNEINSVKEQILSASDGEILSDARTCTLTENSDGFFLEDWYNIRKWYNPRGWCGPNVVSFILTGFGKKSGCDNVPLNEKNRQKISSFYQFIENAIGTGPKDLFLLGLGMKKVSNYTLKVDLGHNWNRITSNIKETRMPSVSLRRSDLPRSFGWHHRAIIGYRTTTELENHKFLWHTWTTNRTDKWFYIHDNGCDGENFWEKENIITQVWSAHVVEK